MVVAGVLRRLIRVLSDDDRPRSYFPLYIYISSQRFRLVAKMTKGYLMNSLIEKVCVLFHAY